MKYSNKKCYKVIQKGQNIEDRMCNSRKFPSSEQENTVGLENI